MAANSRVACGGRPSAPRRTHGRDADVTRTAGAPRCPQPPGSVGQRRPGRRAAPARFSKTATRWARVDPTSPRSRRCGSRSELATLASSAQAEADVVKARLRRSPTPVSPHPGPVPTRPPGAGCHDRPGDHDEGGRRRGSKVRTRKGPKPLTEKGLIVLPSCHGNHAPTPTAPSRDHNRREQGALSP